jgi:hypothetical protein
VRGRPKGAGLARERALAAAAAAGESSRTGPKRQKDSPVKGGSAKETKLIHETRCFSLAEPEITVLLVFA